MPGCARRRARLLLEFAAILAFRLAASGKYNIRLTRNDDRFLPLGKRVAVGRAARADLFISLHADSVARKSARGASIYTLSKKGSDGRARELATRENKADLIAGLEFEGDADVAGHLIDMQQRSAANRSVEFAKLLLSELEARGPLLRRPPPVGRLPGAEVAQSAVGAGRIGLPVESVRRTSPQAARDARRRGRRHRGRARALLRRAAEASLDFATIFVCFCVE